MVQGMSYLQLYYNKACTRELEKDPSGNYIYASSNISTNAIMPLVINFWCKNNGSHTAYETSLTLVSSDLTVTLSPKRDRVAPGQIVLMSMGINIPKGDETSREIIMRFEYDSI